jgi:negative regulator of flagellin synthesis FlgM
MRVNSTNQLTNSASVQTAETQAGKKAEKLRNNPYDSKSGAETVSKKSDSASTEISSKARDLAKAKKAASEAPDVRESRIAELREKIQNKTYNVSADAIADRLVDDHLRMTGA